MSITKEQAEQAALQAKEDGYRPLTIGYELPEEQWMLDNVLADMKRGNVDTRLVPISSGSKTIEVVEVWRKAPSGRI